MALTFPDRVVHTSHTLLQYCNAYGACALVELFYYAAVTWFLCHLGSLKREIRPIGATVVIPHCTGSRLLYL